jgi:SAM-dependent methyltransferase
MKAKVTKYRISCAKKLFGKILDIGAGEGSYTSHLGADVISLDIDYLNLKQLSGARILADASKLPFPADTFDCTWSCAVLEHVHTNYVPEAIRVTKLGGIIYILTPNKYSIYDPVKRLFGLGDWSTNEGHVRLYSIRELREFGKVQGEIWWAPGLDQLARICPSLGHTLMLRVDVTADIKSRYLNSELS